MLGIRRQRSLKVRIEYFGILSVECVCGSSGDPFYHLQCKPQCYSASCVVDIIPYVKYRLFVRLTLVRTWKALWHELDFQWVDLLSAFTVCAGIGLF